MSKYVSDTMALILHLEKQKMPEKTKLIFSAAERGEHEIYIPSMVMAEIGYLAEKGRIEKNLAEVEQKMKSHINFVEVPMGYALG